MSHWRLDVGRADREAVHERAGEGRLIGVGRNILREPASPAFHQPAIDTRQRLGVLDHSFERFGDG
jgi:hypothetical protein